MREVRDRFYSLSVSVLLTLIVLTASCGYCEKFSFAIIADPHINGDVNHEANLENAINWLISNKNDKHIELVFVLGDIAWGDSRGNRNLKIAKETLDHLNHAGIPYIPVMGDNEIHDGSEKNFEDIFGEQYQYLPRVLQNWQKAPVPIDGKYLQNFPFDHKSCHFVCPDFNSRKAGDEGGELHDFAGGTWSWFKNDIENCPKPKKENIVIMTHIGMFRTGFGTADKYLFSQDEMNKIKRFLCNMLKT